MSGYCQLWLTCKDTAEAGKISKALLDKKLITCAKQLPISADFWWQGSIDSAKETLLVMESRVDLFGEVEAEITKLHSYDTFVLTATKMEKISKKAKTWLDESLKNDET